MNYNQAIGYITNISKNNGMVFGLERMKYMLEKVDNPQEKLKIIHIAGTNGKGSVGTYLASVLDVAGYKVGRFISPALFDYREVFSIYNNGSITQISKDKVSEYITLLANIRDNMIAEGMQGASAFEMETVMSLMYMKEENCDICLIECGLGGDEDATNAIDNKLLNIITSIGRDHLGILGPKITDVARHKCGIIREHDTVICAQQEAYVTEVIKDECARKNASLIFGKIENYTIQENNLHGIIFSDNLHGIEGLRLSMLGTYQIENAILAITALYELRKKSIKFNEQDIKDGLTRAHFRGRFDIVNSVPLVIADGAHNQPAAQKLKDSVDSYLKEYKKIYVMGVFKDKEYQSILSCMSDNKGDFISCMSDNTRRLDAKELCDAAKCYFDKIYAYDTINDALSLAVKKSKEYNDNGIKNAIICFGSLSIMKEVYAFFEEDVTYKYGNNYNATNSRIDKLICHKDFWENIRIIDEFEKNRIFCKHNIEHLLDVARIAWISILEENISIKKDIVYAAALLHDIGRAKQYIDGTNHEIAGIDISKKILCDIGFDSLEIQLIIDAIQNHNKMENEKKSKELITLATKLRQADNLSRNCFLCKANSQCKWPTDKKNKTIIS